MLGISSLTIGDSAKLIGLCFPSSRYLCIVFISILNIIKTKLFIDSKISTFSAFGTLQVEKMEILILDSLNYFN